MMRSFALVQRPITQVSAAYIYRIAITRRCQHPIIDMKYQTRVDVEAGKCVSKSAIWLFLREIVFLPLLISSLSILLETCF